MNTRQRIRALLGLERPHDGVDGVRDVDNPCEMFKLGEPDPDAKECWGDGHYLCAECVHWVDIHGYGNEGAR